MEDKAEDKEQIILSLKQEVAYLKGKLEEYQLEVVKAFTNGEGDIIDTFVINIMKESKIDIKKYKGRFNLFYDSKWLNIDKKTFLMLSNLGYYDSDESDCDESETIVSSDSD